MFITDNITMATTNTTTITTVVPDCHDDDNEGQGSKCVCVSSPGLLFSMMTKDDRARYVASQAPGMFFVFVFCSFLLKSLFIG